MYRPLPATATEGPFPEWITPMAATLTDKRFTGPDWVFERKFDGIRLLAFKQGGTVRLLSRNRLPQHIPAVAAAVAGLWGEEVILDGELIWQGSVSYHVFDVMWLSGRDVTRLPLVERRALLETLRLTPPLHIVESLTDDEPWLRACREGWKGVVRAHWVQPEIAVRLAFIEWTGHGKLRHSRLLAVTS